MGTTVEELKRLYTKLGGKDKQVATFNQPGEIINAINELDLPTDYELPKVTTTDAGKVLTVSDAGKWDAETPTKELPAVTSEDEGKVLTVDSEGAWGAETPTKELPAVTSEDAGKVLTVDSEGAWGAETPTKELPAVTSEDNGNILSVVDGEWAKAAPSGGGDFVYISTDSVGLLPDEMTVGDIYDMIESGKYIAVKYRNMAFLTLQGFYGGMYWLTSICNQSTSTGSKPVLVTAKISKNSQETALGVTSESIQTA